MSTISKVRGILFVLIATSVALLVTIVLYSQEQIRQQSNIIETERIVKVNQLASRIDLIITNAEKILENAAKDENIKNSPYISSLDKNLYGIPENVDKEKRMVILNILSTYQDFESIGYILPNGDIYFVEPYDLQKTLSVSNVSFRDYYKAVTATHDTYVGSIIVSAASNHPVAPIAVPVFSENGSTVESINGQKMFMAYQPVRAGQNTWAVVSMQPYDEAFQSVNATIAESYTLGILILIITSLSSYYLYRGFQLQLRMKKELEKANQFLQHAQEELKEVDKSKEEFSAMITHELKTHLVPIIGYCKML